MAATERDHRSIEPPRPGGGGSGEAGGGDSPARWDDDGERVEGLAVSSPPPSFPHPVSSLRSLVACTVRLA
jgi:hypothetical protein